LATEFCARDGRDVCCDRNALYGRAIERGDAGGHGASTYGLPPTTTSAICFLVHWPRSAPVALVKKPNTSVAAMSLEERARPPSKVVEGPTASARRGTAIHSCPRRPTWGRAMRIGLAISTSCSCLQLCKFISCLRPNTTTDPSFWTSKDVVAKFHHRHTRWPYSGDTASSPALHIEGRAFVAMWR
jgi:hypothetical protein